MADILPKLPPKRKRFVDFYLGECRFNASKAALKSGYKYDSEGRALLRNPTVRAHIDAALQESAITRDEVLAMLADDAAIDINDVRASAQDADPIVQSSLVSSHMAARTSARTNLAKAYGLFTENLNVTGSLTREIVLVGLDDE